MGQSPRCLHGRVWDTMRRSAGDFINQARSVVDVHSIDCYIATRDGIIEYGLFVRNDLPEHLTHLPHSIGLYMCCIILCIC